MQRNKSNSVGSCTLLILAGFGAATAIGKTIEVCSTCGHTTIQGAVNEAVDNDVINVGAGHYLKNITVEGKALAIIGTGGGSKGETLIAAAGRGPVFTLGSGVAGDTNKLIILSGVTVSGGNHTGGTGVGGGIQVRSGAYLHLFNSIVTGSYAVFGGGVGVNSPGAPPTAISNSIISDNISPGTPRGTGKGGGVYVRSGSTLNLDQVTIARNQSRGGGGVYLDLGSKLVMTNTIVSGNTSTAFSTPVGPTDGDGGGMETYGDFTISDSFFVNNAVSLGTNGGGGIFISVSDSGPHKITRTTISHNNVSAVDGGARGGGILAFGDANGDPWTLDHSYVEQNLADFGVWSSKSSNAVITNTVVSDNAGGNICIADDFGGGCQ